MNLKEKDQKELDNFIELINDFLNDYKNFDDKESILEEMKNTYNSEMKKLNITSALLNLIFQNKELPKEANLTNEMIQLIKEDEMQRINSLNESDFLLMQRTLEFCFNADKELKESIIYPHFKNVCFLSNDFDLPKAKENMKIIRALVEKIER